MPGLVRPKPSRLLKLEVENFKSYKGRQDIGPFHTFTAVIGPNGSGKSNLMDAISFVLGVKGSQLRGSLKELLCSVTDGGENDRATSGYVKLILEKEDGYLTTFKRSITQVAGKSSFTSSYAVDDVTMPWAAYEETLKTFGILIKARNFLVFQGDIEAVAGKQALELTKLFETISGSDAYKAEFDQLEEKRKEAQDRLVFVQSRKKNTAAEKKQKKEQKAEAEKHIKMQQELDQLKSTYFLWQLFCLGTRKEEAEAKLEKETQQLRELAKTLKGIEKDVKENKQAGLGLSKKKLLLEQKLKEQKNKALKNPDCQKAEAEVKSLQAKVAREQKQVESLEAEQKKTTAEKEELEAEIAALKEGGPDNGEEPIMSQRLDDAMMGELTKLQLKAETHTAKITADLKMMQETQKTHESGVANKRTDIASAEKEIARLNQRKQEKQDLRAADEGQIQQYKKEQDALKRELGEFDFEMSRFEATREAAEQRLKKAYEARQKLSYQNKELDRHNKTLGHISELKRTFKGVHGRLSDLGTVRHEAYKIALAVTMNNDLDTVVVDSTQVAKECVAFLKQRKIPPMTFLPLQTIKVKAPAARLRQLGGTAKMAVDLVDFKPEFEKAFMSACGSTLVCDTYEEGRNLAFGEGKDRHKVVTKDGLLISKSGAMTGGGTSQMTEKANRLDGAEKIRIEEDIANQEAMLRELPSEEERRQKQHELQRKIASCDNKISRLQKNLAGDTSSSAASDERLANLEAALGQKQGELEELLQEMEGLNAKITVAETRLDQAVDKIYAPLSEQAGVNIREYLSKHKEDDDERRKQKKKHELDIVKLTAKLKRINQASNLLDPAKQRLQTSQTRLAEKQDTLAKLTEAAQKATEAAESQAAELSDIMKAVTVNNLRAKELKEHELAQTKIGTKAANSNKALKAEVESITGQQQDILSAAQLEQVTLPRTEGEDEDMDTEEGTELDREIRRLDFDRLSRQHRAAVKPPASDKLEEDFQKDIEARREHLNRVAPNLKAVEQYEDAKNKDDKERKELETARQENSDAQNAFHTVRQRRSDVFTAAFDHIKDVIDPIYKDLTKSKVHPMGGTAYLSLISAETEPFMSGISFTAMPPSKRWRQMEALSGGEKTVAALALLFAIHSFQPAPFFILDEVDAALDAMNVAKVANYIRERTRSENHTPEFQAIVISLKDYFFSKADALVGVTKTPGTGCSTTFTLDLTNYPESV